MNEMNERSMYQKNVAWSVDDEKNRSEFHLYLLMYQW
jgi:hypothetical protein